ncbi:DNA topoisomerase 2-beta-like protein [Dinothrombium tinctorium]|uniref:DNA topoisomerase 2 n=1 Tax=Dinothrombium tinctorium TaxID=1965070 RepID=A0A3S3PTW4_9ACAR|nr:DNA topoisomerase 2-beta-like protein [Dinothrombium tinctorium]
MPQDSDDSDFEFEEMLESKQKPKKLSVERIYQKKTQLEHILLRPDTYIGSVEQTTQEMWVFDEDENKMVFRNITFVPGLYKIFDEILVNAADNKQRDKKMDVIKVEIDPEENRISIYNNGKGIPVVEHKGEKMFVPSLIFGHLLTSSNYNDEEKKVTGGRNGYGAKLCNIFSTKFIVETSCKEYGKSFKQTWTNNMSNTTDAKIQSAASEDYTKIVFYPDLSKFKMETLDKDIVALMTRRAYDVAGTTKGVKVFLNGKKLPIKNFKDYVDLYLKGKEDESGNPLKVAYEDVSQRWEIAVALSDRGFNQVSFVNSIATTKGGRHVDHVTDQVVNKLSEVVKKKNKEGVNIKPFQIKNHMFIFVNCLIENPTFDSQTKEHMTLQVKSFGSKCTPSEKFFQSALKCGITESILMWVKYKAETQLATKCNKQKQSKLKNLPKLDDANDAGKKNSLDCTLILTEGDSAKALVVAGFGVVGRDRYGVFPLRGKLLNVREATHKQILENAEINNIIKIIGLQYKKKYTSVDDLKTLRYGKVMIMTDQDPDGSHIKGLLINFIHHNWPDLLKLPFLEEFITPIVKVKKGSQQLSFFSLPEFEEWKRETRNWHTWKVKYYKGLGTSTNEEAKEYFSDLQRHRIRFRYQGPEDDHSLVLAFSKKMIEQRKDWLTNSMEDRKRRKELGLPEVYLYGKETKAVTYKDFVNKELVLFSNLDNERSIPSMMDGLKPGQRKVLFTCFKRNDKREVKVAQLAGSVGEASAYHHGEASLMATIINLAQNFVGSNNINLLMPNGQFGTRLQGGKDAASPRYIFTMLSPLARKIFVTLDDPLYNYLYDDNQRIEPEYYVPIIPMVLVNGAEGIGTGWSTKIPNYNPREIVENLKRLLRNEEPTLMNPWFKGFRGTIVKVDSQKFVINGEVAILDSNTIEITELPIRTWTQTYKENVLEPMLNGTEKTPAFITDYKEYHTDATVRFVISMSEANLAKAEEQGMHKTFKLQTSMSTTSMVAFDHNGCIRFYKTPEEILTEFFDVRLEFYRKRKAYLEGMLEAEALKITNQARFILEKNEGKLKMENVKKKEFIRILISRNYDSDPVKSWKAKNNFLKDTEPNEEDEESGENDEESEDQKDYDYDYLIDMTMRSMLKEKVEELLKKRDAKKEELEELRRTSAETLWQRDLDTFIEELNKYEAAEEAAQNKYSKLVGKVKGKSTKMAENAKPAANAQRVQPTIDFDAYKKKEAGDSKKTRGRGAVKAKDLPNGDIEEEDKPLAERIGNSPALIEEKRKSNGKLKQTTLPFKPIAKPGKEDNKKASRKKDDTPKKKGTKKGGKRKSYSDSDESDDIVALSDFDDDDSDFVSNEASKPAREVKRRAATTKAKFTFSDSEEEEKISDKHEKPKEDLFDLVDPEKENQTEKTNDYDSDDFLSTEKPATKRTSEELFDTFIANKPEPTNKDVDLDESEEYQVLKKKKVTKPEEKKPATKKPATKKKAKVFSDSEDDAPPTKKAKPAKQTKTKPSKFSSSDEDEVQPLRERLASRPGRNVRAVKYTEDSTDDDD